jgi:hypothetical protein
MFFDLLPDTFVVPDDDYFKSLVDNSLRTSRSPAAWTDSLWTQPSQNTHAFGALKEIWNAARPFHGLLSLVGDGAAMT